MDLQLADDTGIGLADAIEQLRNDVMKARQSGVDGDVQFPVESLTLELKVVATRSSDGRAGFRVPVINAELGGSTSWQTEMLQTVTVVFGSPVDRDGNPVKVGSMSVEPLG